MLVYKQLIFIEQKAIKNNQNWLADMITLFECETKVHSNIQSAKIIKYSVKGCSNRIDICTLYTYANHFELVNDNTEMLNEN